MSTQTVTAPAATPAPSSERAGALAPIDSDAIAPQTRAGFDSAGAFELMQRGARLLASSSLVPQQFQSNLPNCVIALEMAQRLGASPLMVMQNLYVVHGRPAWSSQFLIACVNQCGRFSALQYEWSGSEGQDNWGCRAVAVELRTGRQVRGPMITIGQAKKEGWVSKSGSKWQTLPELMLTYRAATFFARTNAPELTMGLPSREEAEDIPLTELQPGVYGAPTDAGAVRPAQRISAQTAAGTAQAEPASATASSNQSHDNNREAAAPPAAQAGPGDDSAAATSASQSGLVVEVRPLNGGGCRITLDSGFKCGSLDEALIKAARQALERKQRVDLLTRAARNPGALATLEEIAFAVDEREPGIEG